MIIPKINMGKGVIIDRYYEPYEVEDYLKSIEIPKLTRKKKSKYYEIASSFDIETTSFYKSTYMDKKKIKEKVAIMYEWTLTIGWSVMIGRTWEEFRNVYNKVVEYFDTDESTRLIIYVHNLSFEFQFIRKRFEWLKVFSLEDRQSVQAVTIEGIEFRCSYLLSGYSLNNLSNQLLSYKIKKLVGNLDYSLIRNSKTKLDMNEINYCINDTLVVNAYIFETIERLGSITKIPLTKTGYVREYCRNMCMVTGDNKYKDKFKKYRKLMRTLKLDEATYNQLKLAFAGGFTHASALHSGKIMSNVSSYDFTSSYPYVMISEEFPMSSPENIVIHSEEEFQNSVKNYCCLFDIELFDVDGMFDYEHYISKSKCRQLEDYEENNGRIVRAKHLCMSITEQDYFIINKVYRWSNMKIYNFRRFKKAYLPKDFVLSILKLYVDKTELKGIEGKEQEYLQSKEYVNASYGMCVTDICKDEIIYDNDEWSKEEVNVNDAIAKYNKSIKRFLYYPWGIWVTAYARRNLYTAILEFKEDYVYSDTDSIKGINAENHKEYFEKYNAIVLNKLKKAMDYHNINISMTRPKNIKNEVKQIGIWDYEGVYNRFKTLGAKRYMTETNGEISLTVSGVNKKTAIEYLKNKYKDKIFDKFDNELYIPSKYSGKMTHTYIDDLIEGKVKDFQGNIAHYCEYSAVHLENADYTLSIADIYAKFLLDIQTKTK